MGYFAGEVVSADHRLLREPAGRPRARPAPARGHAFASSTSARCGGRGSVSGCPCCRGSRWRSGTSPARWPGDPSTSSWADRPTTGCRCTRRAARAHGRSRRPSRRPSCTARSASAGSRSGPASTTGRAATRRRRARRRTGPGTRAARAARVADERAKFGALREALGPEMELATDCHAVQVREPWSRSTALDLARAIEEFDILFMEEPLRYDDPEGYAALRKATRVPIAGGECLTGVDEFRRYLDLDALDYVQPDATHVGGVARRARRRPPGRGAARRPHRPHGRGHRARVHGQPARRVREPERPVRRVRPGPEQRPLRASDRAGRARRRVHRAAVRARSRHHPRRRASPSAIRTGPASSNTPDNEGSGMTSGTDQGRTIERVETFVVSHTLNPRTGPSIALSDAHAYILVKLTDSDGRSGWGETYLVPGIVGDPRGRRAGRHRPVGVGACAALIARHRVGRRAHLRRVGHDHRGRGPAGAPARRVGGGVVRRAGPRQASGCTRRSAATSRASIRRTPGRATSSASSTPGSPR